MSCRYVCNPALTNRYHISKKIQHNLTSLAGDRAVFLFSGWEPPNEKKYHKKLQTGLFMVLVRWAVACKRTNDTRALLPK